MLRIKHTIILFIVAMLGSAINLQAQSRKFFSQFSHFQSYFNPGLTGYEGSTVRSFVRNQWAGLEGAPKTYFLSAELDFGELGGEENPALMGKNAISVNLLQDNYGAFRENEILVSYASRVRLTQNHNLRLGAGVNYQSIRLDGNALTTEEQNDPTLGQYLGTFSDLQVIDFNLGLALTHANYYLSYGMHRVNGGKAQRGDEFMDGYPAEQIVQAGYRESLSDNISIIANGFYRSRRDLPDVIELNFKALFLDKFWVGAGHRFDYASNFQFGIVTKRLRLGYVYELPLGGSYLLSNSTHEFAVIVNLFRDNTRQSPNQVLIW